MCVAKYKFTLIYVTIIIINKNLLIVCCLKKKLTSSCNTKVRKV